MTDNITFKPDYVRIRNKTLPTCTHADCKKYKIWSFDVCWEHLSDAEKNQLITELHQKIRSKSDMRDIILSGASLSNFDFSNLNLNGSFFSGCDLSNSKFIDSNLDDVHLGGANLFNSDLTRASMSGTVLTGANLENSKILAFTIKHKPINITMSNFGHSNLIKAPHINEEEPYFSGATYQALKSYFSNQGDYDSASWASHRERLMQSKNLWSQKRYLKFLSSKFFDLICGYGEKPSRTFFSSVFFILIYALIYQSFDMIEYTDKSINFGWIDSLYFSFSTFCGYSFPDIFPKSGVYTRLLISSEAFLGIFALGIFIFTLSKRFVAR